MLIVVVVVVVVDCRLVCLFGRVLQVLDGNERNCEEPYSMSEIGPACFVHYVPGSTQDSRS